MSLAISTQGMGNRQKWATKLLLLKKAAAFGLLLSFVLSIATPMSAEAQVIQQSTEANDPPLSESDSLDGLNFVIGQAQAVMGTNYSPSAIRQVAPPENTASSQEMGAESMDGLTGGEMSLMSLESEAPAMEDRYEVVNDIRNSEVNGATGAFTHSIPITIPPGRNGIQPSLELQYSNQRGEDLNFAGYGWDIPIPYIERQNETGTNNLYSDNEFHSSISGELSTTSDATQFIARSDDGSYLKYEFASSTNQWTVRAKDGISYKFGHASTSRIASSTYSSNVFRWMLEEERDANGNYVKYEYFKDGGFLYPDRIIYTGNGVIDGIFTVDFNLELRTDIATSSDPGFEIETKYRLHDITISVDGEWVREYEFIYTTGDNNQRSLLDTVLESGRSIEGTPVTGSLPATNFDYQTTTPGWATSTEFALPEKFLTGSHQDTGLRMTDINGDSLPDLIRAKQSTTTKIWLNNGVDWTLDSNWLFPEVFVSSTGADKGVRLVEVNGDGLVDILVGYGGETSAYLNTGTGWATSTIWAPPYNFVSDGASTGARIADVNGDNLPDFVFASYAPQSGIESNEVRLNTGAGWSLSPLKLPAYTAAFWSSGGVFIVPQGTWIDDINGDSLADVISFDNNVQGFNGVYLNTGSGWEEESSWTAPSFIGGSGSEFGQRLVDVNSDGLADWLGDGDVYLNTGSNWVLDNAWQVPTNFGNGTQIIDLEGDGMVDFIERNDSVHNRYLANGNPADSLIRVDEGAGAKITVAYKGSAQYVDGSGNELNPGLPFSIQTAHALGYNDGFGVVATTTYSYSDGDFYYSNPSDRTLAGFGLVEKTDPVGNIAKAYYHQGNASATTTGEHEDTRSKIGMVYRSEILDENDDLYQIQVTKWESASRGGEAEFARPTRTTTLSYDGDSDHRDLTESYSYSTTTGSITEKIQWGEVTATSDGSFTDTGSDKRTTSYAYAASSTGYLIAPSQEVVTDQSSTKVSEQKYYYDSLTLGSINKGNRTKQESWKDASNYIDNERTYNAYGLVIQEKDSRDKITTYVYDSRNLYIATTTNPLSHVTEKTYDYSSGKVLQTTDPNDRVYETVYDPFDRLKEEKVPDVSNPSSLVTKTTYLYTDTGFPRRVQRTDHLSASTSADSYTYFDGAGKKVQERTEAEENNTYSVKNFTYDKRSLLKSESLPYFSSGVSYTGTSTPAANNLLTAYTYDPLERVLSVTNSLGITTNSYDQWATITTDAEESVKEFGRDAYSNLIEVTEHNGAAEYVTTYEYDGNNKLSKLTDAADNVRSFTYDGLGRRLSAQDLHDSLDGTFGVWSYSYDDASNLLSTTDPKSQQVDFTYDDLNRLLTENYTGTGGTEVTYAYDSCDEGVGRLCIATSTGAVSTFTYTAPGQVASEAKLISGDEYLTSYTYDRQGNVNGIIYPDESEVVYDFNAAGLLESVSQREEGGTFNDIVTDFDYSPIGKVSYKDLGNGVTSEYTYDPARLYRLTRIYTQADEFLGGFGSGGSELALFESLYFDGDSLDNDYTDHARTVITNLQENSLPTLDDQLSSEPDLSEPEPLVGPVQESLDDPSLIESPIEDEMPGLGEGSFPGTTTPSIEIPQRAPETASTTPVEDTLPEIVPEDRLKVVAPFDRHLGFKEFADGVLRYAYRTDARVDDIPLSRGTMLSAQHKGMSVQSEMLDMRTKFSRTFATDQVDVYVTEIVSGDPQYYEDENGVWWLAEYATTTAESYKLQKLKDEQEKDAEKGLLEKIFDTSGEILSYLGKAVGIIPVRAYAASSTFYPDSSRVDGVVYKANSSSWSTTRDATIGQTRDYTGTTIGINSEYGVGCSSCYYVRRAFLLFDTSPIPDSDVVMSASLDIYITEKTIQGSDGKIYVSSSTPASDSSLITDDFEQVGSTIYGESDGSYTVNSYESMPLNQAGISAINKSGTTRFGLRAHHDLYNITPSNSSEIHINAGAREQTGTSKDPMLVVVHTQPPTTPTDLQAEGQTNPVDVQDLTPELSAIHNDAAEFATHYQIQVATSSSFSSTYWDTGKTTVPLVPPVYLDPGERSPEFSYTGPTLATSTTYNWRIKFWNYSDAEGQWSAATSTFRTWSAEPSDLFVESTSSPSSVVDATPEFSAVYNDTNFNDIATHYQIQVASSTDFTSLRWNSGKTALASSTPAGVRSEEISYAGAALASSTPYYWRIKFWDTNNAASVWSTATSTFTLAGSMATSTDVVQDINYTYDAVGNITHLIDQSGTQAAKILLYDYDDLHRLISASTTETASTPFDQIYSYSPIGNILSLSGQGAYTYEEPGYVNPHAPTSIASTSFAYDNNGNLTSRGTTAYSWDYRNRLSASGGGVATTSYGYDHTTERVYKTTNGVSTIYPNQYYDTNGIRVTKNIYANGELIATTQGTGATTTTQYIHSDHLGSTNVVTDTNGLSVEVSDYYPFGSDRLSLGTGNATRKFIGEEYDEESSLSYLNARYYEGSRGQFLSQDPVFWEIGQTPDGVAALQNPQAQNSYSYAGNNPITNKDPNGRFWWSGFYTDWNGYSGMSGLAMKAGEVLGGRFAAQDAIAANSSNIANSSAQTGVSPSVYKAIMYEENSHQLPPGGGERAIENIAPNLSKGGVGAMQVSAKTSGLSNSALLNDTTNVNAGGSILQGIQSAYGSNAGTMGAYYNSAALGPGNAHAASYGARVNSYANSNLSPTLGDRAVRAAAGGISGSLSSLSSALTSLSSALKSLRR